MTATASTNPFAGISLHHRTLGRGKKRKVEAWMTIEPPKAWRDPRFADLRGVGRNLEAASIDLTRKMLALAEELGIIGSTKLAFTLNVSATACAATGGTYTIRV